MSDSPKVNLNICLKCQWFVDERVNEPKQLDFNNWKRIAKCGLTGWNLGYVCKGAKDHFPHWKRYPDAIVPDNCDFILEHTLK